MNEPYIAMSAGCPSCGRLAELEDEDGLRKWVCAQCGYEFGFTQVEQFESSCSLGVPEGVRRAASLAAPADEGRGVFLGGIGRRPE